MLVLPPNVQAAEFDAARKGITDHFNAQMEKILNENSHKDTYWILGKANVLNKHGKSIVRPFLQATDVKPPLVKESFVYQVDNKRGVKELLWVMHPDNTLTFPTLGKSIRPKGAANQKPKGELILPPEFGRI